MNMIDGAKRERRGGVSMNNDRKPQQVLHTVIDGIQFLINDR